MWLRLALRYDMGYIHEPLVEYRWHANNMTQQLFSNKNLIKGFRQENLAKLVSLKDYAQCQKEEPLDLLTKSELAQACFDVGRFHFWDNDFSTARAMLFNSLLNNAWQMRGAFYLFLSCLPYSVVNFLRNMKGRGSP